MVRNHTITAALVVGLLASAPARAAYTSIVADLVDKQADTSYVGGVLSILSETGGSLTLNDPGPLPGVVSNPAFSLTTYFQALFIKEDEIKAAFSGGSLSLTFDFDPDGEGPEPPDSFFIEGLIRDMVFGVTAATPTLSVIQGEGLFSAAFDLPGSNNWPTEGAPGYSGITFLTIAFDEELTGPGGYFDWARDLEAGRIAAPFELRPAEPATVLFVLAGGVLIRRRNRP